MRPFVDAKHLLALASPVKVVQMQRGGGVKNNVNKSGVGRTFSRQPVIILSEH